MKINHFAISLSLSFFTFFSILTFASTPNKKAYSNMWPNVRYSIDIPSYQQVLGYDVGEEISTHADMLFFFSELERAAPTRIKIFEYGRTWEGRKLIYAAIGSAENISNLDKFSQDMRKLADPRITTKRQAKTLIDRLPSSVWLEYGVHGDEISSTDAAMMMAYHLLAAQDNVINQNIIDNTIVFIDPLQNPDGRTRFTNFYTGTIGMEESADRLSAEHNEPWPEGRYNHYLFDMNRDWLALTQPETQGRVKAINKYFPLVVIDLHEMDGEDSYYFAPPAQPLNPHMTKTQINNATLIGRNNAKHFDDFGFDFFTREVYDAFYPGYGDSWPTFYGAAASTYEVSSSRGKHYRKSTGEVFSYRDSVRRHFIASISTAESVADNKRKFLSDFYQYQVSAIDEGKSNKKERFFILPNQRDKAGNHRLAKLLATHGIDVNQAEDEFKACGKDYKAGAYYIDTAQPRGRFVKTVMTKQVDMSTEFITEQERLRSRKLGDEIYDVTGWSLPLMFNIDTDVCGSVIKVTSHKMNADNTLVGKVNNDNATFAYLVPWGDMSAGRFLSAALRKGLVVKSVDKAFTHENKTRYPAGTLIIENRNNDMNVKDTIAVLAAKSGAAVDGVNSSWVIDGPNFGSKKTVTMLPPKIAIAWDEPTDSESAGNTRFLIERQFNYPVTAIRARTLKTANLNRYQVIILPSGDYKGFFDQETIANFKSWVERGGVLITLGSATRFVANADTKLLDVKLEHAFKDNDDLEEDAEKEDEDEDEKKDTMVPGTLIENKAEYVKVIENKKEKPDQVSGVLANIEVDQEHWLTAGVHSDVVGVVAGKDIFSPIKLASGKNVAWFKGQNEVLASGYLWEETKKQLAYKPFLIYQPKGKGMVISYTQEPALRAYLDGLNIMLMNTIFRGAAHSKLQR